MSKINLNTEQSQDLCAFAHSLAEYDRSSAEHYNLDPDHQNGTESPWIDPDEVYNDSYKRYCLEAMTPQMDFSDIPF